MKCQSVQCCCVSGLKGDEVSTWPSCYRREPRWRSWEPEGLSGTTPCSAVPWSTRWCTPPTPARFADLSLSPCYNVLVIRVVHSHWSGLSRSCSHWSGLSRSCSHWSRALEKWNILMVLLCYKEGIGGFHGGKGPIIGAGSLWHKRAGTSKFSEVSSTSRWTSLNQGLGSG